VPIELAVKPPAGDRINHVLPVQLCSLDWAVTAVAVGAVTVKDCEGGAKPPTVAVKLNAEMFRVRADVAAAFTFRVTFTDCAPEDVWNEMVPLQVVPAAIPD
jgi:hypothetical protein